MLKLFKIAIMIIGVIASWMTIDAIFEYKDGLFDISRVEAIFISAMAISLIQLCFAYQKIGYGWYLGLPRLIFLTGVCALTPLAFALWAGKFPVEKDVLDADGSLFQVLWFSCLLLVIQAGIPSTQVTTIEDQ